jgi:hypothetical protein
MWLDTHEGESVHRKTSTNRRHQRKPKQTLMTRTEFKTAQCAGGHRDQLNEDRINTFNGKEGNQTHIWTSCSPVLRDHHISLAWPNRLVGDGRICSTCMGERRNVHRILRGKHEGPNLLEDLGIDGRLSGRQSLSGHNGERNNCMRI